jgi:arylsulfatase A-like enzyme
LRASALGYNGDSNAITPHIDKLAKESVNFTNTVAVCPVCTPYRAALMTGRFPTTTGMFLNDLHLPAEELCMAEIFAKNGYDTGYIGKWHLDGHGRDVFIPPARRQGWDFWMAAECDHQNNNSHYYTGNSPQKKHWEGYDVFAQTKAAKSYIQNHAGADNPFFLTLSLGPPHPASDAAPVDYRALYSSSKIQPLPNVPVENRDAARPLLLDYYAHCTAIDHCIGELLQTIENAGIAENTIFVFTSDHGGMLLSHGLPQHWKQVAYGESAHVPFLIRYPDAHGHKGKIVNTPLNTPDILPTLLALANIPIPSPIEGDNLINLICGEAEIPGRAALYMSVVPFVIPIPGRNLFTQTDGIPYRAIRTKRYTYIRNLEGPWMLFDDCDDPHQINNLVNDHAHHQTLRELEQILQAELIKIGDDFRAPESYIEQWGFQLNERRAVEFRDDFIPQTPRGPINYS